ncbi:MAG: ParA family protein [Phycisphaerae bacterium]
MRRIAVINQKGGVGKTTTTANLGAAVARAGLRVLLVDLDPQAHLSLHFGIEVGADQFSVYDLLASGTPVEEVILRPAHNVSLLPADIDLAGAEAELVSVTGREVLLREALAPLDGQYDCVLIDCPPSLGVLTINALAAAGEILIPLQAHFLALQGLGRLLETVTLVRQRINPDLTVGGIVLCMHESTTRLAGEVVQDIERFLEGAQGTGLAWEKAQRYETCVRRNIKLAESSSFGQTVFDYAPRSNGARDYAALAGEIFGVPVIPPAAGSSGSSASTIEFSPRDGNETPARPAVSSDAVGTARQRNGRNHAPAKSDRRARQRGATTTIPKQSNGRSSLIAGPTTDRDYHEPTAHRGRPSETKSTPVLKTAPGGGRKAGPTAESEPTPDGGNADGGRRQYEPPPDGRTGTAQEHKTDTVPVGPSDRDGP